MTPQVVAFGTFELDLSTGELRAHGQRVSLQDQPAQVLSVLVSRPGEVVTRDELRRALWAVDTFVDFDTALNVAVNKVRQALGDSATTPRFVETVPKHGYRFLADVHPVDPEATRRAAARARVDGPSGEKKPRVDGRPRRGRIAGAGRLLLSARSLVPAGAQRAASVRRGPALPAAGRRRARRGARDRHGRGGDRQARTAPGLRVPSISAVRRYAGVAPNPLQAGRELGVETVLDGKPAALERPPARLGAAARRRSGTTRWARQWDLPWTDVFTVQDAMATDVARELAPDPGAPARATEADHEPRRVRALPARALPRRPSAPRRQPTRGRAGGGGGPDRPAASRRPTP